MRSKKIKLIKLMKQIKNKTLKQKILKKIKLINFSIVKIYM